jgi:hypothetical protein
MPYAVGRRSAPALRRILVACCASALLLAAIPAIATAATPMQFWRATYAYSSAYPTSQEANLYNVIALQANNASEVPLLKAANPGLKVLMYQAIMSVQNTSYAYNSCMTGPWLSANHPSWILHDQNGNPILLANNSYLTDVGNTGYQQTCVANAIATAKADGFDGVFWDMLNAHLGWVLPSGTSVPEYPTDSSWQSAMYSMLTYMGPQLHANGLLVIGNIGGGANYPGLWATWNGPLDGAEEEGWTMPGQNSSLSTGIWAWPKNLANLAWSEANGKLALIHSWSTTETGNTYGLASMMLVTGSGRSTYSTSNGCYSSCETWYPEYTTAQQLGAPVGTYTRLSNGVYWRWYQHGIVVANPTANTIASFSLGGGTYTGSQLTSISSLSMSPTSGYVLEDDPGNVLSAPVDVTAPTISPAPVVGTTVTANVGSWSASPSPTYTYQWSRCLGSSCTAIAGATAATYTVQTADIGYSLQVALTATNSAGIASATSAQSAAVPTPTFTISATPTSATITHGSTQWFTVTVHPLYGFTGSVSFTQTGAPTGATVSFIPTSSKTGTTLSIGTTSSSVGTWPITIRGASGSQTASVGVSLTVK